MFVVGILVPVVLIVLALTGLPGPVTAVLGVVCAAALFVLCVPAVPAEWREVVRGKPIVVRVQVGVAILRGHRGQHRIRLR
ncbi:hypothetical protein CJ468_06489 [Nocardia farcinica]|nr:hypothetical protein CJ468_06489 [Nocardia farcinica]